MEGAIKGAVLNGLAVFYGDTCSFHTVFLTLQVHDKTCFSMGLKRLFSGLFRIKQAVLSFILRVPISCLVNVGHRRVFFTFLNIAEQQE